jgi:exodeoxyribonuclease V gamma subunit
MSPALQPGLIILHGNRLESLAETVFAWLAGHPLAPLEEETWLVQSNGMAEWLKMQLAGAQGLCAATRMELPARFLWRAWRAVLGRSAVPAQSPLDKQALTWRLMRLLPTLAEAPGFQPQFEPISGFLGAGDAARRLQLASRLADLFDQYQVYRADWLHDWTAGRDRLAPVQGVQGGALSVPVPAGQGWQPALWRAVLAELDPQARQSARDVLHQRFLKALAQAQADPIEQAPRLWGRWPGLPRRVVLFGSTHVPQQALEAIAALAPHCQVLMAVPNPCRYHWADLIEGHELLRAAARRHPLRPGRASELQLAALPALGHPLLAAWGRQARDFVRQLDAFDDVQQTLQRFQIPRVDLFDEGEGATLLQQVQARIRDLVPLAEHALHAGPIAAADRSIVFHLAHSAQREVEILHDQLLDLLAQPPAAGQAPLNPRDIVVMVPDIELFTPALRAVFGQHGRDHPRHIPWGIADQRGRGQHPLLVALEWLLRVPQQRFTASELRDLLDVPALAARFGLAADDLPTLLDWMEGAGADWGLHAAHRASLGLQACGELNSWRFGLRRMLLGYATGEYQRADAGAAAGIEPYAEIAGLEAGLAGALAELLDTLEQWWRDASQARSPAAWAQRLRALLADCFAPADEADRAVLAALEQGLAGWLQACETAAFDDTIDLAVLRETWLEAVDAPDLARRFRAGGVTFCTLLPLRAIPFQVVCLLGMNEGDYPRRAPRSDFDLMALPGLARPGDRSRRDDDRQLMLDALLSARRVLYLSWVGRSQRDNQAQQPSVLVSQLRDYLARGWGEAVVRERSTDHPLQPFSRRYFEMPASPGAPIDPGLITYASEWRSAHGEPQAKTPAPAGAVSTLPSSLVLSLEALAAFLRNPVKAYFRHRLQVSFDEGEGGAQDDEAFALQGLDRWRLLDEALRGLRRRIEAPDRPPLAPDALLPELRARIAALARSGRLPLAGPGRQAQAELESSLLPMLRCWQALCAAHPFLLPAHTLSLASADPFGLKLDDALDGLRAPAPGGAAPVWIDLQPGALVDKKRPRPERLLKPWLRCLASAACGAPAAGILVGADAVARFDALPISEARACLIDLLAAAQEGLTGPQPLPTALLTGLAWLADSAGAAQVYEGSGYSRGRAASGSGPGQGEGGEACLARLFPDFASLSAQPGFSPATQRLYAPYAQWLTRRVRIEALPEDAAAEAADGA